MLRRDDVETLRQRLEERQPADMAARAMQEDKRRATATAQHADPRAAELQHVLAMRHSRRASSLRDQVPLAVAELHEAQRQQHDVALSKAHLADHTLEVRDLLQAFQDSL